VSRSCSPTLSTWPSAPAHLPLYTPLFFPSLLRPSPRSTLFPYTTLFRSRERFIRANKLGADYEREGLEHVFARQIEREQEHERAISRNEGTQRTDEKLYQSSHERGNGERSHDTQSIESDSRKIGQS